MNVTRKITIARAPEDVYAFWRDLENLPRFMHHLESVTETGGGRSHWIARAPAGRSVEWDAEIVEDLPNELIAWRTVGLDDDVRHSGAVSFLPAAQGTEVRVELTYDPPGGGVGAAIARLFGEEPGQQIAEDLLRFKHLLERGSGDVERPIVTAANEVIDRDITRKDIPGPTDRPIDPDLRL